MLRTRLRAKWLFPDVGPPIPGGILSIVDGKLESISPSPNPETPTGDDHPDDAVHDLGNVALLPRMVNAHTHLEFSDLEEPISSRRGCFTDWIRNVLQQRANRLPGADELAIGAGLAESQHAGVCSLGEIATTSATSEAMKNPTVGGVRFFELIGISPERRATCLESANTFLESNPPSARWQHGLSPHAPYTTSLKLVDDAVKLACNFDTPVAMHLAETKEELQLLASHEGPFRQLLDERSLFDPSAFPQGTRAIDYLTRLAQAPQCLIIHGNYLEEDDLQFLADNADRMALVYCPRTHSYFQHDGYPLRRAVEMGVRIAFGTDSRASNPDLSLFQEVRHAATLHPDVSRESMLRAATDGTLLGAAPRFTVGKPISLASIQLNGSFSGDPYETLLSSSADLKAFSLGDEFEGSTGGLCLE